jgi:hypothetical protein
LLLQLYDISKLFFSWRQFNYVPHIILAVLLLLNAIVPRPRPEKKDTAGSTSAVGPKKDQ